MSNLYYKVEITSQELARWLEEQSGSWWSVDGDPLLTSEVDFPCPNDELAGALSKLDKEIIVFAKTRKNKDRAKQFHAVDIDELADTKNPRKEKNILAAWKGSDVKWLLTECKSMEEAARENVVEPTDAKAAN